MEKEITLIRKFLGVIIAFLIFLLLKQLRAIFIPLTFASLLGIIFSPMNRKLQEHNIPKPLAIAIVILIIFVSLMIVGTIVYTGVSSFVTQFPVYEERMLSYSQDLITKFEIPIEDVKTYLKHEVKWFSILDKISLTKIFSGTMGTFADFTTKVLLTLLFLVFLLSEKDSMLKRIRNAASQDEQIKSHYVFSNIEKQVQTYLRNKTFISLLTAITGMIVLAIFKVDFIVISGLLLFVLNFVPNIGSIIANFFPIIVYFFEYGADLKFLLLIIILTLMQMTYGNIIEPRLMGTELKLSPLFLLISLIFWAWLWGPIGMVLAIPLTSALKLVSEQFESMKLITAIMGDIPEKE